MKKMMTLVLALLMVLTCLTACGAKAADSDLKKIQDKGKLIVGITDYAPMDYKDENGEWTGFDAEFAKLFAEEIGVEVEFFVLTDWGMKFFELDAGNIDVVWNGMTITDEVKLNSSCSDPYVINAQVVVMKADEVSDFEDVESLKSLNFAVENGSAGQAALDDNGITTYVVTQDQAAALLEVKSGTSDACVIDITMANAMTGAGTNYEDLAQGVILTSEEYGVAFRKDSDMTAKFNELLDKWMADGTLDALAEKYGLTLAK